MMESIKVTTHCSTSSLRMPQTSKGKNEQSIAWPDVKPKFNLSLNRLKGNDLFTVAGFLNAYECQAFIKAAEDRGFSHQSSLGPAHGEAFRDNERISVYDDILAEKLWNAGLCNFFTNVQVSGKSAVGLNPNIRLYKYKAGQRFGQHIDESVDFGGGRITQFTLLIYLNGTKIMKGKKQDSSTNLSSTENLVGGETVFYGYPKGVVAEVQPIMGMALFHIHGDQCMTHEARVVSKGEKYVLRSDVIFE